MPILVQGSGKRTPASSFITSMIYTNRSDSPTNTLRVSSSSKQPVSKAKIYVVAAIM